MMGIETMKNVSPKTVDRSTLVQRSSIRLNPAAPREDRLREFIKQIRLIKYKADLATDSPSNTHTIFHIRTLSPLLFELLLP